MPSSTPRVRRSWWSRPTSRWCRTSSAGWRPAAAWGSRAAARPATTAAGELMIAFSTANRIPLESDDGAVPVRAVLDGPVERSPDVFNELFAATTEAVEEAVVNALFTAETTVGRDGNVLHALPLERTLRDPRPLRARASLDAGRSREARRVEGRGVEGRLGAQDQRGHELGACPPPGSRPRNRVRSPRTAPRAPTRAWVARRARRDARRTRSTGRGASASAGTSRAACAARIRGTSRSQRVGRERGLARGPGQDGAVGRGLDIGATSRVSPASPNSRIDRRSSPGSLGRRELPARLRGAPRSGSSGGTAGVGRGVHEPASCRGDRERDADGPRDRRHQGPAASTTVSAPTMPSSVTTPVTRSPRATRTAGRRVVTDRRAGVPGERPEARPSGRAGPRGGPRAAGSRRRGCGRGIGFDLADAVRSIALDRTAHRLGRRRPWPGGRRASILRDRGQAMVPIGSSSRKNGDRRSVAISGSAPRRRLGERRRFTGSSGGVEQSLVASRGAGRQVVALEQRDRGAAVGEFQRTRGADDHASSKR